MSFETQIKSWVNLDNQLRILNEKIKDVRVQRNDVNSEIIQHVQTENLNNATVQISDGKLRFVESRQTTPLTLKYVKECLDHCISSERDVENIMQYIKESRSVKIINDIKRTYIS